MSGPHSTNGMSMAHETTPSILLSNGQFHRDAFDEKPASALLIESTRIAWIGDRADAPDADRTIDLNGACVLPGLTDAHIHVFALALARHQMGFSLHRPRAIADIFDLLRQEERSLAAGQWLQGCEINEDTLAEKRLPTRQELDAAFGARPVLLRRYCGHAAIFNTATMRLLGLDEFEPDHEFGHFERCADGSLNGIAFERAAEAIFRAAPSLDDSLIRSGIRDVIGDCVKLGLTSLTEAAVGFSIGYDREDAIWQGLRDDDDVPVRMGFMAQLTAHEAAARGRAPVFDRKWSGETLKFFADGIVGGRTSAMSEPFCDRGGTGTFVLPEDVLVSQILEAHEAGWRVAVHATGDRAIELVADAYEKAGLDSGVARGHRMEHCFCPPPGVFERLHASGAFVVMQPSFLWRMGPSVEIGLGRRIETAYPGRSVLDAGAGLAFSSDAPTGLFSPWEGVRSAVERLSSNGSVLGKSEAVSVREAVHAYVGGGASVMRHDHFRGRLKPGFAADLTALDRNPFDVTGAELAGTRSILTMVDGRTVHHDA
jgi:predicted amidohydrolase YtcJ